MGHSFGERQQGLQDKPVVALGPFPKHPVVPDVMADQVLQPISAIDRIIHEFPISNGQTHESDGGNVPCLEVVTPKVQIRAAWVFCIVVNLETFDGRS